MKQYYDLSNSIMDNPQKLTMALKDKKIFMTSCDYLYMDGKKQRYNDVSYRAIDINGIPMFPVSLLSILLHRKVLCDGLNINIENVAEFKIGSKKCVIYGQEIILDVSPMISGLYTYIPVFQAVEKLMHLKATWDARGLVILSDYVLDVQRVHFTDRHIEWHESDLIYRFMQYEHPSGQKMVADLRRNFPNKRHSRLILLPEDVQYINDHKLLDETWAMAYSDLMLKADRVVLNDNSSHYAAGVESRQVSAVELQFQILDLAWAYLLTHNEKYAKKGVEIINGIIEWDSVNYERCNLISGHWCMVIAIGFDTFYDYMMSSKQGKRTLEKIKDVVYQHILAPHIEAYTGKRENPHYITMQDNFAGVCGGGLMCLLLAMCDEENIEDECAFLLENCLRTLEMAAGIYFPDGGYYESVGYSQYMLRNFVLALVGMKNCFNELYGLDKTKGFDRAGYAFVYLQSTDYNVNYHDGDLKYVLDSIRDVLAYIFNDPKLAAMTRRQKKLGNHFIDLTAQFYNFKVLEGKTVDLSKEPLDWYYEGISTGAFQSSLDVPNPTFVGFHAGYTGLPHDMLDLGEFVFESDNTIWAFDLGGDDYGIEDYFAIEGYRLYRKSPEGKNCVVLNPAVKREGYYGQELFVNCECIMLDTNKSFGAMAAFDLTLAYKRDVEKYVRGYYFGDNRQTLIVRDEIKLKGETEIYWFMHTAQQIEIVSNIKAVLTSTDGKRCFCEVLCDATNYQLKVMEAVPLPSSAHVEGQADNVEYRKLAIHVPKCNNDITITVKLIPEQAIDCLPLCNSPISEWKII